MMKDEEARRITAVEAFRVADKKSQELTTKMTESQVPSPKSQVPIIIIIVVVVVVVVVVGARAQDRVSGLELYPRAQMGSRRSK